MDPREHIRQLMRREDPAVFPILFDLLEEQDWDPELVEFASGLVPWKAPRRDMPNENVDVPAIARLLGELAKVDYPRAVDIVVQINRGLPRNDYRTHGLLVDAINTAWFSTLAHHPGRTGIKTWEDLIRHEQMEEVTGETNEPWEGVLDEDGTPTARRWTTEFIPEWLVHEVGEGNGPYRTVYDEIVGPEHNLRDSQGLWRQVQTFNASREAPCPLGEYDENVVTLEHTYHGEHPGESCALCEGTLGEEHGDIYLGEMGATIYQLDVANSVTRLEIEERGHRARGEFETRWEIKAFAGEDEVEIDDLTGDYYATLEGARQAIREARGVGEGDIPPDATVEVLELL